MTLSHLFRFPSARRLKDVSWVIVLCCLCFHTALWSQSAPPPPPQANAPQQPSTPSQPSGSATQQLPGTGAAVQDRQSDNSQQPEPEGHITKQQAKDLFRSVDEILGFVSGDTGLPIEHKIKRNLITREQVEKFVGKRMKDDKDEKRLEQAKLVLQKFGLLPAGYDLHAEFIRLMAEQVAAFYDPRTKSVNVLDWLPADAQKPVLAHELTHALQDQQVPLDKWELAGAKDDAALPDQQEYFVEEAQSARQCVTEGQAQVVWFDYTLAPMNKTILTAPEFVDAVRAQMGDNRDSPEFAKAPMFLQESMLMPYTFGLDFVRTVLANKGKDAAFKGLLTDPPVDTRQIMQPETYLLHQVVPQLTIPNLDEMVAPNYTRFDFGGMGEFDIYLLAKQYGAKDPPNYYRHWRGGYYYAAQAKNGPKDQIAMLYFSRWDSPQAASDFARLYLSYLPKLTTVTGTSHPEPGPVGQPEPPRAGETPKLPLFNTYDADTKDGPIRILRHDNDLLIMEGYDDSVVQKAQQVLLYNMTLPAETKGKGSK
ncbi:MAG TPA: hypothetical protein VGG15_11675 [Terriglobales bacterium]|jgi:hypothetical protein